MIIDHICDAKTNHQKPVLIDALVTLDFSEISIFIPLTIWWQFFFFLRIKFYFFG